jgi:hypothetical protein
MFAVAWLLATPPLVVLKFSVVGYDGAVPPGELAGNPVPLAHVTF